MTDADKTRIVTARKPKRREAACQAPKPAALVVEARSPAQIARAKRIQRLRERGY